MTIWDSDYLTDIQLCTALEYNQIKIIIVFANNCIYFQRTLNREPVCFAGPTDMHITFVAKDKS